MNMSLDDSSTGKQVFYNKDTMPRPNHHHHHHHHHNQARVLQQTTAFETQTAKVTFKVIFKFTGNGAIR